MKTSQKPVDPIDALKAYVSNQRFDLAIQLLESSRAQTALKTLSLEAVHDTVEWLVQEGVKVRHHNAQWSKAANLIKHVVDHCAQPPVTQKNYHYEHLRLLQEAGVVNQLIPYLGYTPLHAVVLTPTKPDDHKKAINLVLNQQFINAVSQTSPFGNTPLHDAIANEATHLVAYLVNQCLKHQITVDGTVKDKEGKTALVLAAKMRDHQSVDHLLQFESVRQHIDLPDKHGRTALHYACMLGDEKTAEVLLKQGSSLTARDCHGRRPLDDLTTKRDVIKNHFSQLQVNPDRPKNATRNEFHDECFQPFIRSDNGKPVDLTIPQQKTDAVKMKLKQLEQFRLIDIHTLLLSQIELRQDNKALVASLLDQYNNLSEKSLAQACLDGQCSVLEVILNRQLSAYNNWLLRYCAADPAKHELLTHMTEHCLYQIDINRAGQITGMTALHQAVKHQNIKGAIALMKAGADINQTNHQNQTAFDLDQGKLANLALRRLVSQAADTTLITRLLNYPKVDVNAFGEKSGKSALHRSVEAQNHAAMKQLLKHNANVNQPDQQGNMPLHLICKQGDVEALKTVLEANPQLSLDSKATALIQQLPDQQQHQMNQLINATAPNSKKANQASHAKNAANFGVFSHQNQQGDCEHRERFNAG